ncbi:MAG: hypothetical protein SchgKO_23190 [Schleiferiaceae bacterium]
MKAYSKFFSVVAVLGVIFLTGCRQGEITPPDEYYVKYEVSSSTIYIGGTIEVVIRDEKSKKTRYYVNTRSTHEIIIGPVSKGFLAHVSLSAMQQTHDKLTLYSTIYVSKNGSPFAIKGNNGSDTPRDQSLLEYKIDY